MRNALLRYRVLAFVVGTGLVILCCVGLPLQYIGGHPIVAQVTGTLHGFLFIVYVLTTIDLMVRCRWKFYWLVAIVACGTIPFFTFVAEHYVTKDVKRRLAAQSPLPADAGTGVGQVSPGPV